MNQETMKQIEEYAKETYGEKDIPLLIDVVTTYLNNDDINSVGWILRNYQGRYDNVEDFVKEQLGLDEVADKLNDIEFRVGRESYNLDICNLNLTGLWLNLYKLSGAYTAYKSEETGYWYVWSKFQ
jgi:hypothetical protein